MKKHQDRTYHVVTGDAYGTSIKVPSAVCTSSPKYSSYPHDGIGQTYVSPAATLQQLVVEAVLFTPTTSPATCSDRIQTS
jgi:hypothetical protein